MGQNISNKIMNRLQLLLLSLPVFLLIHLPAAAQDSSTNKYGLKIISNAAAFRKSISNDPSKAMVDLSKVIPKLVVDLRYAGTNNFMKEKLYPPAAGAWLRKAAADSLAVIQKELAVYGLGLKIFDAYRPWSVTEKMWEKVKDDRYAADPKKGSNHNRGIAVDLTIVDIDSKLETEMGTGFDNFSDTAHHDFKQLPMAVLNHRALLKRLMEKHGFKALDTEWWHYSLVGAGDFELLDLGFEELKKIKL